MSGPSQHVFEPVRHGEPRLVRLLKSVDARRSDFEAPLRLATALRRRRADLPAQVSLLLQAIKAGVKSSARDRTASPHLELAGDRCAECAVLQPEDREQQDLLELTQRVLPRHGWPLFLQ